MAILVPRMRLLALESPLGASQGILELRHPTNGNERPVRICECVFPVHKTKDYLFTIDSNRRHNHTPNNVTGT